MVKRPAMTRVDDTRERSRQPSGESGLIVVLDRRSIRSCAFNPLPGHVMKAMPSLPGR